MSQLQFHISHYPKSHHLITSKLRKQNPPHEHIKTKGVPDNSISNLKPRTFSIAKNM